MPLSGVLSYMNKDNLEHTTVLSALHQFHAASMVSYSCAQQQYSHETSSNSLERAPG